jgi:uncharacterized protein YbjT (DUF2867 family)
MKILICGATGFVGRNLTKSLQDAGYTVIRAVRRAEQLGDIEVDFMHDTTKAIWLPRLCGVTAVINVVGVLRDSIRNPMQKLHDEAPVALFAACAEVGVKRIVHFSALGIDKGINTPYFNTRIAAEQSLNALPSEILWLCLRPSVIYGEDGASAKMFRCLAKLPIHLLPMGGHQKMQPVHINDIKSSVIKWLGDAHSTRLTIEAVGAEQATMREMLDSYREQLLKPPALHLDIPSFLVRLAARVGDCIPMSPLCTDTLNMLLAGNTADVRGFAKLLGYTPSGYRRFIADHA